MISVTGIRSDFRSDINGLRAWAVIAVVFYHFGVPGFGGGFVGVDVFFVISGFLMTSIVLMDLEQGSFSLFGFYMARARRILPALIVLCAVLLTLGWQVLLPLDYKELASEAVYSLAFISNIKFWRQAGYFDASAHEKWLLHTWSLAVEWQFYLLLPLVLFTVWRLRPSRRAITGVMLVGLLVSLALSIILASMRPTLAFYSLPTRAWEMLAGGLVYLLGHRLRVNAKQKMGLEAIGLGLVMASVVGFSVSSPWPGWRVVVPVSGSVLVLLAIRPDSRWTGGALMQWLGTCSYSLYLWHWPVVVALVYLQWQAEPVAICVGLLLTMVLGHLSYRWVETPARQKLSQLQIQWSAVALACGAIMIAGAAVGIRWKHGVAGRLPVAIEVFAAEALNKNPRRQECLPSSGVISPACMFGGNKLRAILLGDSHADAIVSALAVAAPNSDDGVMEWAYASCATLFGALPTPKLWLKIPAGYQCGEFLNSTMRKLADVPRDIPIVIVNRTTVYAMGYNEPWEKDANTNTPFVYFTQLYTTANPAFQEEFAQRLIDSACQLAKDRPVYLVRPIPEMAIDVPKTARAMVFGRQISVSISLAEYHKRHTLVWAAQNIAHDRCGVKILDPLPYLCADGRCNGAKDGRPLYYDDDHLSEYGNKLLVPMFSEVFKERS